MGQYCYQLTVGVAYNDNCITGLLACAHNNHNGVILLWKPEIIVRKLLAVFPNGTLLPSEPLTNMSVEHVNDS